MSIPCVQSYLWDNDRVVAEWVEHQMEVSGTREEGNTSYLQENLQIIRRDNAISQVKEVVKVCVCVDDIRFV